MKKNRFSRDGASLDYKFLRRIRLIILLLLVGIISGFASETNSKTTKSKNDTSADMSSGQIVQSKQVTGTVIDKNNEPLPGVSVNIKGTLKGTITDSDGQYRISGLPDEATLIFSFVGMKSQEIPVNSATINVTLEDDAIGLDEVVAIGYGSVVRKELTGSVGSVSGATLERVPVSSAAEALQGKIAGVQVTTTDGAPGSEVNIRIRGGTSVTQSNAPLFIVDGFPADNINDIPPTDIQSIDILKDASVTAIYGARGGNGVVLVTTKSAKAGKLKVTFNHNTQVRSLARKIDLMNPYEFVKIQYEAVVTNNTMRQKFRGDFGPPTDFDLYKRFGAGNDWQDEILGGNPISSMDNLTIGGGKEGLIGSQRVLPITSIKEYLSVLVFHGPMSILKLMLTCPKRLKY